MWVWIATFGYCIYAQRVEGDPTNQIRIAGLQGKVDVFLASGKQWRPASTGEILQPFDRLRCSADSRVALLWSDQSVIPFGPSTEIEILPPQSSSAQCGLHLLRGIISFFHRDKPDQIQVITRGAIAGVEGTEFVVAVDDTDETTLSVIDGKVRFGNSQATLTLTNGQQAIVPLGKPPARTAGFIANNLLQWSFYYPAILDLHDLSLTDQEQKTFDSSFAAYQSGDLLAALQKFSARNMNSDSTRMYYASLLLSVGEVDKAEAVLSSIKNRDEKMQRLVESLQQLVAAVKRQPNPSSFQSKLPTEFLASSYYEQSRAIPDTSLERALDFAKQAAAASPQFGFAWERVAELEFSFGHTGKSLDALNKSLSLSPQNPEALTLKGFLLAAQNRTHEAISWFNRALAIDSAFGNAWLGRGLCRIRIGDSKGGREDLLMAAALEPQRAEFRSYLGKAYANVDDFRHAAQELQRAKNLDPNDPTGWLYSALLKQERNQINDAIRDLEKSEELNDNRSVYRSQLLLDQDQAVRSASLATMYQDDGMFDVSVNEASRAVNYDYANYSAHLFLADSYEQLSDPNEINLRYETPAESEYLVANLLAPVGAGTLSPTISQGEYSKLFTSDGPGVISDTEYLSRGAWTQSGAQFGTFGNFSYDFEAFYHSDPGQWVNNDIEQRQLSLTVKQQLSLKDSIYLNIEQYQSDFGDVQQYYNPAMASSDYQANEKQTPIVVVGYNHEWAPGIHTLFLGARLNDTASFFSDPQDALLAVIPTIDGVPTLTSLNGVPMTESYQGRLNIYSGELQQIFELPSHTTIVGTRIQYGNFNVSSLLNSPSEPEYFSTNGTSQNFDSPFKRFSFYGYHEWQIFDPLQIIGGLDYDQIIYPENFRIAPISGNEKMEDQFSPKAGFIFAPLADTTVRFAYTKSLSGASLDQSYQIEPSQVAGFIQNYRSIMPESIVGGNAGAHFETYDLSLEQRFRTGTYLTISGEILNSTVDQIDGLFTYFPSTPPASTSGIGEDLTYQEKTLQFAANQLLGKEWSLGLKYRLSQAILNDNYPSVPNSLLSPFQNFEPRQRTKGVLNSLDLTAIYNHPCGFFTEGEALWYAQNNDGYTPSELGDKFWQFNAFVGYRSPGRNIEISLGILNITSQGYNLNPLNIYDELPLTRTLAARFQFNF
jgi:tetratricopeptide (TPR) repeat protein